MLTSALEFSMPKETIYQALKIEMIPIIGSDFTRFDDLNNANRTIGKSVVSGEIAIGFHSRLVFLPIIVALFRLV